MRILSINIFILYSYLCILFFIRDIMILFLSCLYFLPWCFNPTIPVQAIFPRLMVISLDITVAPLFESCHIRLCVCTLLFILFLELQPKLYNLIRTDICLVYILLQFHLIYDVCIFQLFGNRFTGDKYNKTFVPKSLYYCRSKYFTGCNFPETKITYVTELFSTSKFSFVNTPTFCCNWYKFLSK